jgi:hypothetical protein
MAPAIEHGYRERREISVAPLFQRGIDDNGSLCERKDGHGSSNLCLKTY